MYPSVPAPMPSGSPRRRLEAPRTLSRADRVHRFLQRPAVELAIILLVIASIAVVVLDQSVDGGLEVGGALWWADVAITLVFAAELSARYAIAKKKRRFFRRYWPDLIALAPPVAGLQFLRLLRFLRLFRVGLLLSRRLGAVRGLFRVNVREVWVLVSFLVVLVVASAAALFLAEARMFPSFGEAVWWSAHSVIAAEPIGALPTTPIGKLVVAGVMLSGMSLFAVFTGVVSATVIDRLSGRREDWEMDLDEIEGHIVICGYNAGVPSLLHEIAADDELGGVPVVLVNELERMPDLADTHLRPELVYHCRGDHARLEVLERARISRAARAVVIADAVRATVQAEDRDARTVLAALTIEKLNPRIYCTVELMDPANESHLRVAGVEAIVMRNDLSGRMLATACRRPELVSVIMDLVTLHRGETIKYVPGPAVPRRFDELIVEEKRRTGLLPIAVARGGEDVLVNPAPDYEVRPSDFLVVITGSR